MPLSIPDARTMSRSSCDECCTSSVIVGGAVGLVERHGDQRIGVRARVGTPSYHSV